MKKLMLIALALIALQINAQDNRPGYNGDRGSKMKDVSPEESANLKAKRMTLNLDLSEKQQDQVYQLFLKNEKERQEMREARQGQGERPSKEAMENIRLDKQIEMKRQMKGILNQEQYSKWEKLMEENRQNFQGGKEKRRGPK